MMPRAELFGFDPIDRRPQWEANRRSGRNYFEALRKTSREPDERSLVPNKALSLEKCVDSQEDKQNEIKINKETRTGHRLSSMI